jgi:hypothetical protein
MFRLWLSGQAETIRCNLATKAREFVEFFVKNAVHEDEQLRPRQGVSAIDQLVHRCLTMAETQGIPKADIEAEFGDLSDYFRSVIDEKNADEKARGRSKS